MDAPRPNPDTNQLHSPTALKNLSQTSFMLAFFTAFWTGFMVFWALHGEVFPGIVPIAVGAALVGFAVWLLVRSIKCARIVAAIVDEDPSGAGGAGKDSAAKKWDIVFTLQGCAIGVGAAVLAILGQYVYIVPVVLLIVGLHFIPIGMLYKTGIHYVVAGADFAAAAWGIITLLTTTPGGSFPMPAFVDSACALVGALSSAVLGVWIIRTIKQGAATTKVSS
ncbi:MAG: hypothetical protein LBH48_04000 [Bifidobacteriaceae bacterium]|jgi:hypothetical protein|nr:hypothetical protein [Bifidobacteriaceae bacterium]